jgi:hypothetical protein
VTTQQKIDRDGESSRTARAESSVEEARDRLAGLLPDDALQSALEGLEPEDITGPGGLLTQLAGRVVETALGAELTEHLDRWGARGSRCSDSSRHPRRCGEPRPRHRDDRR